MRVGIDIDGPLYPWHYSIYRYFTEFKNFGGDEFAFWDYFRAMDKEAQDYYVSIHVRYLDQSPSQDVLTYVPLIADLGEVFYITARNRDLEWATQKFFKIYELPFKENIIFSKDKANYVRINQIDYFVDDIPANVDSLKGITDAYLFKAPHNRNQREGYNVINSMKEFYELLRSKNDK